MKAAPEPAGSAGNSASGWAVTGTCMTYGERNMSKRAADLAAFLDSLERVLLTTTDRDADAMVRRVFGKLADVADPRGGDGRSLPVCGYLDPALAAIGDEGHPLRDIASGLRSLAPQLVWTQRPGPAPNASGTFAEGHANAMIVGPTGIEDRKDLWIGISLLAPGVRYPDHDHAPPEVYLVLSDGAFRQGDGDWFSPGVGGMFFNPPGILHAMAAGEAAPLVALWLLDVT